MHILDLVNIARLGGRICQDAALHQNASPTYATVHAKHGIDWANGAKPTHQVNLQAEPSRNSFNKISQQE